jgi:hypothetical protein
MKQEAMRLARHDQSAFPGYIFFKSTADNFSITCWISVVLKPRLLSHSLKRVFKISPGRTLSKKIWFFQQRARQIAGKSHDCITDSTIENPLMICGCDNRVR